MGLAERADVIVDFTNVRSATTSSRMSGRMSPSAAASPMTTSTSPIRSQPARSCSSESCRQSLPIRRRPRSSSSSPRYRRSPRLERTRALALVEEMSMHWDGPEAAMLGTVDSDGNTEHKMWADPVSENPNVGDTEVWELYNTTADAHPMHIHEVVFEVMNRERPRPRRRRGGRGANPTRTATSGLPSRGRRASRTP